MILPQIAGGWGRAAPHASRKVRITIIFCIITVIGGCGSIYGGGKTFSWDPHWGESRCKHPRIRCFAWEPTLSLGPERAGNDGFLRFRKSVTFRLTLVKNIPREIAPVPPDLSTAARISTIPPRTRSERRTRSRQPPRRAGWRPRVAPPRAAASQADACRQPGRPAGGLKSAGSRAEERGQLG